MAHEHDMVLLHAISELLTHARQSIDDSAPPDIKRARKILDIVEKLEDLRGWVGPIERGAVALTFGLPTVNVRVEDVIGNNVMAERVYQLPDGGSIWHQPVEGGRIHVTRLTQDDLLRRKVPS